MTTAPLLVLCALAPEAWALRGGDWSAAPGGPPVLARTGMGPRRAGRAVSALLARSGSPAYGAVVVAGFGAAAGPGTRPGQLVVAHRVHSAPGRSVTTQQVEPLVRSLRALGLDARTGALHSADHVVRGAERRALHRAGVTAVDMESAAVLERLPSGLPVAAVRVVVDTPERELLRPGTLTGGLRAFRSLRALAPALAEWYRGVLADPADPATNSPSLPMSSQEVS